MDQSVWITAALLLAAYCDVATSRVAPIRLEGYMVEWQIYDQGGLSFNPSGHISENSTSDGNLFRAPRPGSATRTHSCNHIRVVPDELRSATNNYPDGLDEFYQKYTEAYNIPILGSSKVPDDAIRRICYIVRFLFADRADVRHSYYQNHGRFMVMAESEVTLDVPEHSWLDPYWNERARGLGPTPSWPLASSAEENVLCYDHDPYRREDIGLHEFCHAFSLELGAYAAIPGFRTRLNDLYKSAKAKGLWQNTYAITTVAEYFAEGAQSYFDDNDYRNPPNGIHNHVATREVLRTYDPDLYQLFTEMWPCDNHYIKRCEKDRVAENDQELKMDCGGEIDPDCRDDSPHCSYWSMTGECERNPGYMLKNCKMSCGACGA